MKGDGWMERLVRAAAAIFQSIADRKSQMSKTLTCHTFQDGIMTSRDVSLLIFLLKLLEGVLLPELDLYPLPTEISSHKYITSTNHNNLSTL